MTNIHKPGRNGLSYVERTLLKIYRERAATGKSAPSQTALLHMFADQGMFFGAEKLAAAKARMVGLGLIDLEEAEGEHVHRHRVYVVDSKCWTGWTDNREVRLSDKSTIRNCIVTRCGKPFLSSGPGNRRCPRCRVKVEPSPMDFSAQASTFRVLAGR